MKKSAKGVGLAIVGGGRVGLFRGEVANRHPTVKWIGLAEKNPNRAGDVAPKIGADFVKTSTGYGSGGATNEDLKLMRANVSSEVQVKAAGGVRDLNRLLEVLDLGVTRVGATATVKILEEAAQRFK